MRIKLILAFHLNPVTDLTEAHGSDIASSFKEMGKAAVGTEFVVLSPHDEHRLLDLIKP